MSTEYTPPKVWSWDKDNGGKWAGVNRPIAGATHDAVLPVGDKDLQLYSLGTPNGIKITIMLEELLALGITDAAYDLHTIDIGKGEQFGSEFTALNPNSKIPVLLDKSGDEPESVFESCAILHYLANKHQAFWPEKLKEQTQAMSWLFWQESGASFVGGGFGHFYQYAPYPMQYPIDRYAMETKRQLDVLDRHLTEHEFMVHSGYSIADIAIWAWYGRLAMGDIYTGAAEFLDTASYQHVIRWAEVIAERNAVKKAISA